MRKVSLKKRASLGDKPVWPKRKPIKKKNPARRKAEFARCYGSKARVEWIKGLRCIVSDAQCSGLIDNAHTRGDGAGRKGDASLIVPLCHFLAAACGWAAFRVEDTSQAWRQRVRGWANG